MDSKDIELILKENLNNYQNEVNFCRAIPSVFDGLKPVHRRIFWGCSEGGYTSNKEHKKSARIVGDVMGRYHPHGDSSIYEALIRLAQPWKMRYPLIDVYGNMGNIGGDGPAAMRYTNARLCKLAEDGLLQNINKQNVNFTSTYDEDDKEPIDLPATFPNLLCNPNDGIGWARACNWLPHNFREVATAINDFMDGKEPMLPGPDFSNGCQILNAKEMPAIYKTGKGTVKFRARYTIDKNSIIFYEIPYGTTTEGIIEQIKEASEKIPEIISVTDLSTKKIQLVIKCEKGADLDRVALKLYSNTSLQTSESFNQVAIVGNEAKLLSLKDAIYYYVEYNINCLLKEINFDLTKAKARLHIVKGLLICLEDIDNVIALIKQSASSSVAKNLLMDKYKIDEEQAKAVLNIKLSSLAKLEKTELETERDELIAKITEMEEIIQNRDKQISIIRERLNALVKKYGDDRRTELANIETKVSKEEKALELVVPEDVFVITTQSGLIKKVPVSAYKVQKRNTKGIKSSDDAVMSAIKTNTVDVIMFFTNNGKMYRCLADDIPNGDNASRGVSISTIVKLSPGEKVVAVTSLHRTSTPEFVIFMTKEGMIKKSFLTEYTSTNRNTGIAAIGLKEGDEVVNVIFQDKEDIVCITQNGMSIRFNTSSIGAIGRTSMGVKAINLAEGDKLVAGLSVHKDNDTLALFTKSGLGKKIALSDFPIQSRGGKGTIAYKNEIVVGAAMVDDTDNILISGNTTSICISAKDIPMLNKTSQGNIMIKHNQINSITKF